MEVLAGIDIILIVAYFVVSIGIALLLSRKAGRSSEDFFLSGRKLPWWIAGTTMVATTFAADTPLAVTELVAEKGIAGNWIWWSAVAGNVLTVFFFAKLWRRANVLTDVEFIEIRYSGKEAAFLRGFKAIYLGVFLNAVIMGWVNIALSEILIQIFGISENQIIVYIFGAMLLVGIYSAISGLWGIAFTDMFQFAIAMAGCIILAVVVLDLPEIGGIEGLKSSLPDRIFNFFPTFTGPGDAALQGVAAISVSAFFAHIAVQWWSSWYPGAEPGGGGYVAQRMMSAKDERHSLLATLWFTVAHYALRPWPWIIVALASLILFPELAADNKKAGFIMVMKNYLPPGLLGMLVAAFLAAYMSTISTQLNWGTSYIINDFYRRFIKRDGSEKHYVRVSRIATLLLMVVASLLVLVFSTIKGAWEFVIECGAGLGLVLILRWYWWRINAWSEITAMVAPIFGFILSRYVLGLVFPESLYFIVAVTTVSWVAVTFLTKPSSDEVLKSFYKRTHPGGPGWKQVAVKFNMTDLQTESLSPLFVNWLLGIVLVYGTLFGSGYILFGDYVTGIPVLGCAVISFAVLSFRLKKA